MRGADFINAALPDELLDDVIRRVGAGGGGAKRDLDACALVCRRWRRLERASRRSARLAASGERADEVLRLVAERFTALAEVSVDERLTAAGAPAPPPDPDPPPDTVASKYLAPGVGVARWPPASALPPRVRNRRRRPGQAAMCGLC